MLFSSPDYPVFLIAVFFLYALARWGGERFAPARLAVMVLLGDIVFVLVAKDPDALWDPIGGVLIRLAIGAPDWTWAMLARWVLGLGALVGALEVGRRRAGWLASDRGQAWLARGLVAGLGALGATVALAAWSGALDDVTAAIAAHGHLAVLIVLGVGLGATRTAVHRAFGRVVALFVASSLFYQAWASAMPGPYRYLLGLLLATIALDYYLGLWIERTTDPRRRKALVVISLCSNLGVLVFFKYADFFSQDVLGLPVARLDLILPAGISFHTFQSLSYTIDVYRGELRATRSIVTFATFVLFFPQLVAGPIVRAQTLLPQLEQPPPLELEAASDGLFRIVIGLGKKVALADTLALAVVDRVFEAPERFSAVEVAAGVCGYALQIYLDFSAYSDIAIGSAQVLGFRLPENFRTPYRAANLQEFWRRWHISLSTWLRDYLYIALGGGRGAPWRTYLNLIVTMLLGGLWHGASWTFLVWGGLHGGGLAVTRYFQRTASDAGAARRMLARCAAIAVAGVALQRIALDGAGAWSQLVVTWLYLTPLWAVLTAWLSREQPVSSGPPRAQHRERRGRRRGRRPGAAAEPRAPRQALGRGQRRAQRRDPELLRLAMCLTGAGFLAALAWWPSWTWIPLVGATWGLGIAADVAEPGRAQLRARLAAGARRALAVALVFPYVCLAWIFFRASSFDRALAVLRQLATLEADHANLTPIVTLALSAGAISHLFADGSFRWLRLRFIALPPWGQGAVLAVAALVLRELGHARVVPFIYFQF
jgi:alginate O-acetyltransferase complex protein AlgI